MEFEADAENVRAAIAAAGSIKDPSSILFTNVSEFSLGRRRLLAMGVRVDVEIVVSGNSEGEGFVIGRYLLRL